MKKLKMINLNLNQNTSKNISYLERGLSHVHQFKNKEGGIKEDGH